MLKILSVTGFEPAIIQLGDRRLSMHGYHALLISYEEIEGIGLDNWTMAPNSNLLHNSVKDQLWREDLW